MRKVLLFHSDPVYLKALSEYLSDFFHVQASYNSDATWSALQNWKPDVVLVEVRENQKQSDHLIQRIRNHDKLRHIGLIAIGDESRLSLEETAFLKGADDFLPQSIKLRSLVLRIGALIKRIDGFQELQESILTLGSVTIDPKSHQVRHKNQLVEVTPTQYALLLAFACHPNQVLTRSWLQQNVWKGQKISLRSIDAQISKLKKILPALDEMITNVYGEGYLFSTEKKAA